MKDWVKSNLNMINRSNLSLLSLMRLFKPTGVDQILVGIYINLCMKQINVRCQNIFKRQFLIRGRGKNCARMLIVLCKVKDFEKVGIKEIVLKLIPQSSFKLIAVWQIKTLWRWNGCSTQDEFYNNHLYIIHPT